MGSRRSLVIGDYDIDGNFDLAVARGNGKGLTVLLGLGNGTFRPQVQALGLRAGFAAIAAADVDSDGKLDLILAKETEPSNLREPVAVLLGTGNGTFSAPYLFSAHDVEPLQSTALAVADFNNDGGLDLAVADADTFDVSLLLKTRVI